jgi:ABC-type multidrug transport system ATPase subunit
LPSPVVGALLARVSPAPPATSTAPILAAEGVHKRFGGRKVLAGASFAAARGQIVAILGENGSGKSTLLKILAGRERMDHGRVVRDAATGYCPQDAVLYPYLTPDEHFELFARAYALPPERARARADELLGAFGFAGHRRRVVHELSGGTRQKLNLALALLHDPPVLLLDEPYAGFDIETYHRFVAWCDRARREGRCVVLVTHLVFEQGHFDAIFHLRDGTLHAEPR